jgi:hypothetical protein
MKCTAEFADFVWVGETTYLGNNSNRDKLHVLLMARGKQIPEDMRWVVIRLSAVMTVNDVAMYTDLSTRSIARILDDFKKTGAVKSAKQTSAIRIPRTNLCEHDVWVCSYFLFLTLCLILCNYSMFSGSWTKDQTFI